MVRLEGADGHTPPQRRGSGAGGTGHGATRPAERQATCLRQCAPGAAPQVVVRVEDSTPREIHEAALRKMLQEGSPESRGGAFYSLMKVPFLRSSIAWRSSALVFITIGPYQATGSSI